MERSILCTAAAALIVSMIFVGSSAPAQAPCGGTWEPGFGATGADARVRGFLQWDDGTGPRTFAWGSFTVIGNAAASGVGIWNGESWSAPATATARNVVAIAVHDDGSGATLYALGENTAASNFAAWLFRWNGSTFVAISALPAATTASVGAATMVSYDDGSGSALYVGGAFTPQLPLTARVLRWRNSTWSDVAGGAVIAGIRSLVVHDDGTGPALYAGGRAGTPTQPEGFVARWNGAAWSLLPSLTGALTVPFPIAGVLGASEVRTLASYVDGSGPALIVGGRFAFAGGVPVANVAQWTTSGYAAIGAGIGSPSTQSNDAVSALVFADAGAGPQLFAGGALGDLSTGNTAVVRAWDGASWTTFAPPLGSSALDGVTALSGIAASGAPALAVGGLFNAAGSKALQNLAVWDRQVWRGSGGNGISGSVRCLAAHPVNGTPVLFAGGDFASAGDEPASNVAGWSNGAWFALSGGANYSIETLASYDDGSGLALFVGGYFDMAGGAPISRLARWTPSGWSAVGAGTFHGSQVSALLPVALPSLQGLVVGGSFSMIGGVAANAIALWDGAAFHALGGGMIAGTIKTLCVHDEGSGPALYAGGTFDNADGGAVRGIARWNGVSWAPVGSGAPSWTDSVGSLVSFDDGNGPALYAAGSFASMGNAPGTHGLARWRNGAWSSAGGSLGGVNGAASALAVFDEGYGPVLMLAGAFTSIGSVSANKLARWDGNSWAPFAGGVSWPTAGGGISQSSIASALASFDDGSGPSLWTGGSFRRVGGTAAVNIARWSAPRPYLEILQSPGPGGALFVRNSGLTTGREYANIFSFEDGPLGLGPYLGLYASDPSLLLVQGLVPPESFPFRFTAAGTSMAFGPYSLPPGLIVDGLCFDRTSGLLGCFGLVRRIFVH